ncbi:MAG TPA: hypothetical protein VK217_04720 [Acidimicrobiales bacterium]|nr:hypothetical protein [Acidimicrobiales bacterium]
MPEFDGGLAHTRDYFFAGAPADPDVRESASVWVCDENGTLGMPRIGIEAVAKSWDERGLQVNVGFPGDRTVVAWGRGEGHSPIDDDGICRTFGAGGLEFRCEEPFARTTVHFDGSALDTNAGRLARSDFTGPQIPLRVDVALEAAAPPWVSGTLNPEARAMFDEGFAGAFISPRYEQLCTCRGTLSVGDDEWRFRGTALRIHRQGPRDVLGFWGHCWASALFPSRRGFGVLAFPERPGVGAYNEGFVLDGETLVPATIVDAPWLRRLTPNGENVSLTLRTAGGDLHVEGETILAACMPGGLSPEFPPALHQACVRYRLEGEETFGMMERSIPVDQLEA